MSPLWKKNNDLRTGRERSESSLDPCFLTTTRNIRIIKLTEDRGRFCVLTKEGVCGMIFKGESYAKTSSKKK